MWVSYFIFLLIIIVVSILVSVAFFTLLERKIMGYVHIRKGPNKVFFMGIGQPFADAGKLFFKELILPFKVSLSSYFLSIYIMMLLMLMMWMSYPWGGYDKMFSVFFFVCCLGLGVYPLIISGWSSWSKYSILGSVRAVAQALSYEISILFFLFFFFFVVGELVFLGLVYYQGVLSGFFYFWWLFMFVFFLLIAEMGRTPFDFIEGESELVSGFNIEFSAGFFAVIFIAEYGSLLLMSGLIVFLFFFSLLFYFEFFFRLVMIGFLMTLVRVEFPRARYDKLMGLSWEISLPISLLIVFSMFFYWVYN